MTRLATWSITLVSSGYSGITLAAWFQSHRDFTDTIGWLGVWVGGIGIALGLLALFRATA